MYRDVVAVAKSMHRASMVVPSLRLVALLAPISGRLSQIIIDSIGFEGSDYCVHIHRLAVS